MELNRKIINYITFQWLIKIIFEMSFTKMLKRCEKIFI